MRVAVVGSRGFKDLKLVDSLVERIAVKYPDAVIVSGRARGVDAVAEKAAEKHGLDFDPFEANWTEGKLAGKRRNWTLARSLDPGEDQMVACWDGWSNGTSHAVTAATHLGVRAWVYAPQDVAMG